MDVEILTRGIVLMERALGLPGAELAEWKSDLTSDEVDRADRLRNLARREAFIRGRQTVRTAVGSLLGIRPQEVPLTLDEFAMPMVRPDAGCRLRFSISHSRTRLVVAFSPHGPIGVDVEDFDPEVRPEIISRNHFHAREQAGWQSESEEQRLPAFYRLWTCKEAAWKYFGGRRTWGEVEVTTRPGDRSLVRANAATATARSWIEPNRVLSLVADQVDDVHRTSCAGEPGSQP